MTALCMYSSPAQLDQILALELVELFSCNPGFAWCLEETARPLDNARVGQPPVDVSTPMLEEFSQLLAKAHDRHDGHNEERDMRSICCLWPSQKADDYQIQNGSISQTQSMAFFLVAC
jgi:hypothetical protein